MLRFVLLLTPIASLAAAEKPPPPAPDVPAGLVNEQWTAPKVPTDLAWHIMTMPERALEATMLPLYGLVSAAEHYRLDKRFSPAASSQEKSHSPVKFSPILKWGTSNGIGIGAVATWSGFFDGPEYLKASGVVRRNGDYRLRAEHAQIYESKNLRWLETYLEYDVDTDEPYYGIGAETPEDFSRTLSDVRLDAAAIIDIYSRGTGRHRLRGVKSRFLCNWRPGSRSSCWVSYAA